jgi:uracil-DNA glycosylase
MDRGVRTGLDLGVARPHDSTMQSHPPSILDMIADQRWRDALEAELPAGYAEQIAFVLASRVRAGERIAPVLPVVFRALDLVPIDQVRVVIVGQDPYPTAGDADRLAFSANGNGGLPSSSARIFAELRRDLGCAKPSNGNLTLWAQRGVLLLNTALTTKVGTAWGHASIDWETFTRAILRIVASRCNDPIAAIRRTPRCSQVQTLVYADGAKLSGDRGRRTLLPQCAAGNCIPGPPQRADQRTASSMKLPTLPTRLACSWYGSLCMSTATGRRSRTGEGLHRSSGTTARRP